MHIDRLTIRNFRNIEHLELLDLPNALALFGLNGHGKSSVLDALRMVLLDRCPHTDAGGKKAGALVRATATEALIEAQVDIGLDYAVCVQVCIKPRGGDKASKEWLYFRSDTGEMIEDITDCKALWSAAGIPSEHAKVSMLPEVLLEHKELGDIMSEFVCANVDRAQVLDHAGEHAEWLAAFATEHHCSLGSVAGIKAVGSKAYEVRRDLNVMLAEDKARTKDVHIAAPKDNKGKDLGLEDLPRIKRGIGKLETQRDDLLLEKGKAGAAPSEADMAKLQEAKEVADTALAGATKVLEEGQAVFTAIQEEVRQKDVAYTAASQRQSEVRRALEAAESNLAGLATQDAACPTCGRKYTAKITETLLKPLELAVEQCAEEVKEANAHSEECLATLDKAHDSESKGRFAFDKVKSVHDRAQRDVAAADAKLDAVPPAGRSNKEINDALAGVEEKIERGHGIVEQLDLMAAAQRVQDGADEAARLTWAVEAFRDGKVLKDLVSGELDDFTSRCSTALEPHGYQLIADVDGKLVQLMLRYKDGPVVPVPRASQGQKALVQWAIAEAFADTGAPVILDNINDLDQGHRTELLRRLREKDAGTVFAAAAWQQSNKDMTRVAAALDPVRVVWVEDGGVVGEKHAT